MVALNSKRMISHSVLVKQEQASGVTSDWKECFHVFLFSTLTQ